MTIQKVYPPYRPSSIYNVLNGRPELPVNNTFTRASEGTYVNKDGVIKIAAIDQPRFDYDPETGEFLGLMLEEERTNSLKNTNEFECFAINLVMNPPPVNNVTISPDGTQNACQLPVAPTNNICQRNYNTLSGFGIVSFFVKKGSVPGSEPYVRAMIGNSGETVAKTVFNIDTLETFEGYNYINYSDGWFRLWKLIQGNPSKGVFIFRFEATKYINGNISYLGFDGGHIWGCQLERVGNNSPSKGPSSYIETVNSDVTRSPDAFSLTSFNNFNSGFSLLLDSETTTDDFIYKLNSNGDEKASLNIVNGTLDWDINRTSAQTNGSYPQVGFVNGRVRTISSYGPANNTVVENYLYTTGLSFPTNAKVPPDVDEIVFGIPQTLKALYVWNGQLEPYQAVALIKGDPNIVPNIPIASESYSFVYNTDPNGSGIKDISLPGISPTAVSNGMQINWGDSELYEPYNKDVLPVHAYPYPGQYRIQITADDGFDSVELSSVENSIIRVDQWPPQYRVGASGPGFTGDQLNNVLAQQTLNTKIPAFKYSGITEMISSFSENRNAACNNWNYVATDLPDCVTLRSTYARASTYQSTAEEKNSFPQLQTSTKLTECIGVFSNSNLTGFVKPNGTPTIKPFSNTTKVTDFTYAVYNNNLTDLALDLNKCITLKGAFYSNSFETFPSLDFGNVQIFESAFKNNVLMTTFPENRDFTSATDLKSAWEGCSVLNNFPYIETRSVTTFENAWKNCSAMEEFPELNFDAALSIAGAWMGSTALQTFPSIETPLVTDFSNAWYQCIGLSAFPSNFNTSIGTKFNSTWRELNISVMPFVDVRKGTGFTSTWRTCSNITEFPSLAFNSSTDFGSCWRDCSKLKTFPKFSSNADGSVNTDKRIFEKLGTLKGQAFDAAWSGCALNKASIENILVSLDENGQADILLGIDGGTNAGQSTWSTAANTAYTNLINKGWTIISNP